ncbi:MAG TPA: hypothetical protein VMT47_10560 [Polyangia bacterium]|nr:hypothetical protein [Polyangia bacterium]
MALCALAGCYATNTAPATRTASLRESGHGREVVLEQGPTGTHIGPRSWVRFDLRDGSRSRWFEADTLRVNHEVVLTSDGPARAPARRLFVEGLRWDQVETVEVNDFDLGETMAGVTAGSALIVTAATAEVLLLAVLESMTEGRIPRDLGITRAAVEVVAGKALQRPPEHPAARAMTLDASAVTEPDVRPLFSSEARRRDLVLFTVSTEAGVDAGLAPAPVAGVAAGVRIDNFLDLQLGARGVLTPATADQLARLRSVPFLRLALHVDLDAARRVALAAGADFAATSEETRVRFLYGVRVRVTDRLQLGLYPWNPVAVNAFTPQVPGPAVAPGPSRLNLLELSWLL